jgi:hypothetical protein
MNLSYHGRGTGIENALQDEIYERVGRPIVDNVLAGYNGAILAYGQARTTQHTTTSIEWRTTRRERPAPPASAIGGGRPDQLCGVQSGAGKTFTMVGDESDEKRGLLPRLVEDMFEGGSHAPTQPPAP